MSPNHLSSDLESQIHAAVEPRLRSLRDELMARLADTEDRLGTLARRLTGAEPAAPEPAAAPADAARPAGGVGALHAAVIAMDVASSQPEVLAALLEGAGRFAGRSALFLTQPDGLRGWGSYGFEEGAADLQELTLASGSGRAWSEFDKGDGCVALDASDCAAIASQLGAPAAAEGLLAPFVLRDRVVAALYADRHAADPPLDRQAIQLLTHVAALSVESLSTRQRGDTPTLRFAGETRATEELAAPLVEVDEAARGAEPAASEDAAVEPAVAEQALPEPTKAAEPLAETPAAEAPEADTEADKELWLEAEPDGLAMPEIPDLPPAQAPATATPTASTAGAELLAEADLGDLEVDDATAQQFELEPAESERFEPASPPEEEATRPLEPPPLEPPPPPPPATGIATEPAAGAPAAPSGSPAPPPALAASAAADRESTEVRPPTDHEGPGWAFTGGRVNDSGNDAQQEEARRLARLLVTEIKLYNEEQVEEGRRSNDIYPRLKEDIDRSRQIFNERVDPEVRDQADYFHEEMVRILAAGKPEALGI